MFSQLGPLGIITMLILVISYLVLQEPFHLFLEDAADRLCRHVYGHIGFL